MKISNIVTQINRLLADELYPYSKLEQFMDQVIDDINDELSTCYPVFSEVMAENASVIEPEYNFFPDKYIRSVVVKGAAYKFYIQDEEGIDTAERYGAEYYNAMFIMLRDFVSEVPEEYRVDHASSVDSDFEEIVKPQIDPVNQGWGW